MTQSTLPPSDLNAEQCLIGSAMFNSRCLDEVTDILSADCFFSESHRIIWSACLAIYNVGRPIDPVVLSDRLRTNGELDLAGGDHYLIELMESIPNAAHAKYYAEIVKRNSLKRELFALCQSILDDLGNKDHPEELSEILAHAESKFTEIHEQQITGEPVRIRDILLESLESLEHRATHGPDAAGGLLSGFAGVDKVTSGMKGGQYIVLAARPSMGKTAYICNMLMHLAMNGKKCLFFSLEQSKAEVTQRLLVMKSLLDGHRLANGELDEMEVDMLLQAANEISEIPLWIDDTAARTMPQIATVGRRHKRRFGIDLIVIDYLQIIEPELSRNTNREQQVSQISRRIKQVAKELEVPVIALAQLNREIETRPDKRPKLSDLRESGSIEQDADVVMFLNRPSKYDPDERPGEVDIAIEKNRNGETGTAVMNWNAKSMRFTDREGAAPDFAFELN